MRALSRAHAEPIVQVFPYDGKLDTKIMLDWSSDMEKFFEFESTPNNRKEKIIAARLKCRASLWWEHLKTDR